MRIAITGSSGFVGSAVVADRAAAGHEVVRLVRPGAPATAGTAHWDPATGELDRRALGDADAVVHLAGENLGKRWTAARRRAIADSRGPATERLCRSLAASPQRPRVLVAASAVGIYGDRGDEELDERSASGTGFLADVTRAWEAATRPAADAGIRVVNLRFGMVLDPRGGALRTMLRPFRLGVGGRLGNGRQWISWTALADVVRAVRFAIDTTDLAGPCVAVAPEPVTNHHFTKTLGAALHRPTVFPVPAFALRLLFGEMAGELLLSSIRARPGRLLDAGFRFDHPELSAALRTMLATGHRGTGDPRQNAN